MHSSSKVRWLTALAIGLLVSTLALAQTPPQTNKAAAAPIALPPAEKPITRPNLKPTQADAGVAYLVARLLGEQHYSKHALDDTVSSKFFDLYFNAYDPQHLHFLQSDVDEFNVYRQRLDDLTLRRYDASPAFDIFDRFYERLEQRVAYIEKLLKTEKFAFDTDERVELDRRRAPFPKDLAAARKLMDWVASKEANVLFNNYFGVVAYPGVTKDIPNYPKDAEAKMAKNDFAYSAKNRAAILAEWTKRYDGKSAPK